MIFVDSSVWIDFFNGKPTAETDKLDNLLGIEKIVLGDLVLMEVLQGFKHDRNFATAQQLLTSFTITHLGGQENAINSADNFRFLRQHGITVCKTIDVLIATYCINHNIPLLHSDKDFAPFHKYLHLQNALTDK